MTAFTTPAKQPRPIGTRVQTRRSSNALKRIRIFNAMLALAGRLVGFLVFLFLIGPLLVMVGSSFSPADYLEFPPSGLSLRWYQSILTEPNWVNAFRATITVTAIAVPVSLALGVPAAYALGHRKFRGQEALANLFLSPLMLPEVMIGTALLYYVTMTGLANSVGAVVVGHVVVILPFVVRLVLVSVQSLDPSLQRAAAMLGASPFRIFWTVTAPQLRPGLFAATAFAVVLSIGELAVTVFLAGPTTSTVPVTVYSRVLYGFDPTITAVSSLLAFLAFPVLILLDRWVGLDKMF